MPKRVANPDSVEDDDGEVEYKRNLPSFGGIKTIAEKREVKKKIVNNDKTLEADAKRQNALAEKWKTLQQQKFTIANALKGESSNKKIKFDDDGDQPKIKKNDSQTLQRKISLFDDDNESEHENSGELVADFKLKLRFEGEKGKKLFHLQTHKATGDDRFTMDKRFFEEQETTEKMSDGEIEKQMNILEDVVGRSVTKPKKDFEDRMFNMVRYDPTQEEHQKYIKDKPELPKQKRPTKQKQKQKIESKKIVVEPVVDTNKYYKVDNQLKDVFSSENQFSLTSLFPKSDEADNVVYRDEYQTKKITKPQKLFGPNPFIDDSSDSENEESNLMNNKDDFTAKDNKVSSEKILGSRGVWRETFFFKENDSRFKDGEEFYDPKYNTITYSGNQDPRFIKKREILRAFLKTKDKRHTRTLGQKMFSRKLGGTHNNQKPHKNHNSKFGKSKNKFRGKNVKPAIT